jgi:hypothetical protein
MRKLLRSEALHSRLLFALAGALACLVAAAIVERIYTLASARYLASSRYQEVPFNYRRPGVLLQEAGPQSEETARRVRRYGAQSGDVQLTLSWDSVNDLDLHCIDPSGDRIFYRQKQSSSGGELDVDMNASAPLSRQPIENIFWPTGAAPLGRYQVLVHHYRNHGGADPTPYRVEVTIHGTTRTFEGTLRHNEEDVVTEFTLEPASVTFMDGGGTLLQDAQPPVERRAWLPAFLVATAYGLALLALLPIAFRAMRQVWMKGHPLPEEKVPEIAALLGLGLAAGVTAQAVFMLGHAAFAGEPPWAYLAAYLFAGATTGFLASRFFPPLRVSAGVGAGMVGALVALALLFLAPAGDGGLARVVGATIIGAGIGFMIVMLRPKPPPDEDGLLLGEFYRVRPLRAKLRSGRTSGAVEPLGRR